MEHVLKCCSLLSKSNIVPPLVFCIAYVYRTDVHLLLIKRVYRTNVPLYGQHDHSPQSCILHQSLDLHNHLGQILPYREMCASFVLNQNCKKIQV